MFDNDETLQQHNHICIPCVAAEMRLVSLQDHLLGFLSQILRPRGRVKTEAIRNEDIYSSPDGLFLQVFGEILQLTTSNRSIKLVV
jgi:hypothetical protein